MMHSQILIANLPVSLIFILFLNGQRLLKLPGMLFYSLSVCFGGACGLLFFYSSLITSSIANAMMNVDYLNIINALRNSY